MLLCFIPLHGCLAGIRPPYFETSVIEIEIYFFLSIQVSSLIALKLHLHIRVIIIAYDFFLL